MLSSHSFSQIPSDGTLGLAPIVFAEVLSLIQGNSLHGFQGLWCDPTRAWNCSDSILFHVIDKKNSTGPHSSSCIVCVNSCYIDKQV